MPLIVGLFGFIVIFKSQLTTLGVSALVGVGIVFILFTLLYRARAIELD